MTWLARLGRRPRILVHRDATERAMDLELRHHVECETAERIRRGQAPDEAHRAALLDFGGIERIKEVSVSLARALWPGQNAIGRRLATTMFNNLTGGRRGRRRYAPHGCAHGIAVVRHRRD